MKTHTLIFLVLLPWLIGCNEWPLKKRRVDQPAANPAVSILPGETALLVCAGQSNMVGNGQTELFDNDPWVTHVNTPLPRRGPCYAAAVELAHKTPEKLITAVNCAVGGSSIDRWVPGADLYNQCVSRVNTAKAQTGGKIIGFLFYQGEANYMEGSTTVWPSKFKSMVAGMRGDLPLAGVPVVYAQIGAWCDHYEACTTPEARQTWADFQEAQTQAQAVDIEMITTKDIPTSDGIHHDRAGFKEIGHRFVVRVLTFGQ